MGLVTSLKPVVEPSTLFFDRLNALQMSLQTLSDLHQILQSLVFVGRDLIQCDHTSIILWDPIQKRFEDGASTTGVADQVSKRVRRAGGATRWIIENQKPIIVEDTTVDPFSANKMIHENRIGAYVGVPLVFGTEPLGVLYSLFKDAQILNEVRQIRLERLATVAAISIKYAQRVRELEAQNRLLSDLTRSTMQDLVEPLSLAMGFCDMVSEGSTDIPDQYKKQIEVIKQSHFKMNHLITEVQRFEKLLHCYTQDIAPICLNYVAKTAQQSLNSADTVGRDQIHIIEDASIPHIAGDYYLLVESVKELVENGLRSSPDNRPIMIKTVNLPEHVMISVKDYGEGLAEDQIEQIFEPFQVAPQSSSDDRCGLGLCYVKVISQMHGGYIQVKSQVGEGSEFQLYFPKLNRALN